MASGLDQARNDFSLQNVTSDPEIKLKNIGLDPGSQELANAQLANAQQSPEEIQAKLNSNQQYVGNLGQGDQQLEQQSQQINIPKGQLEAIRNVYAREAGSGIEQLKNQNLQKAQMMKGDYLNQTAKAMIGQHQQAANQYKVLTDAYTQQEAARAGAINSMFQLGDTAIGMQSAKKAGAKLDEKPTENVQQNVGGAQPVPTASYASPGDF